MPAVISGRHIRGVSLELTYPTETGCSISGDSGGMSVILSADGYDPDDRENVSSEWDNIPLILAYPFSVPAPLTFTSSLAITNLDWRLPQYTALTITKTPNTKAMTKTCPGGVISAIAPGALEYEVKASIDSSWTSIVAPRVIHQEWVLPDLNVLVKAGILEVEIDKVIAPGRVSVSRAQYDPGITGFRLGGDNYVYDVNIDAVYEGNVRVTFYINMSGLTEKQKSGIAVYHNSGAGWQNATTEVGADHVTYEGPTASPFVVLVPVDDTLAPQTSLSLLGAAAEAGNKTYISSETAVELFALDTALDPADVTGVATTYYLIDAEPAAECLATPYNAAAAPGTCANPVYTSPFVLSEGVRAVSYLSADKAGNYEAARSRTLYVDGTAPKTALFAGGAAVENAGAAYMTDTASITITAVDQESNGVSSNVKEVYLLIDATMASCGELGPVETGAPVGSCRNYLYTVPFRTTVGTHTVYYGAVDNVGNQAGVKSARLTVIGSVYSSIKVGGYPEVSFNSPVSNTAVTPVALDSAPGIAALAEASAAGLQRVSNLYELGPDGNYPQSSNIIFSYSPAALPAGILEAGIAVYEHFTSGGWVKLSGQAVDAVNHRITAPVTQIASLFAIFSQRPTLAPGAAGLSEETAAGLTARWTANGNPAGTLYSAQLSTAADFSPPAASTQTVDLSAIFSGLAPNTTYFGQAAAYSINTGTWTAFTPLGSASTLANAPASILVSAVNRTSVSLGWDANNNPVPGTDFELWRDVSSSFTSPVKTIVPAVVYQAQGLAPDTTYYFKVRVSGNNGAFTAFDSTVSTATWPPAPGQPGTPVGTALGVSSVSWSWSAAQYGQTYKVYPAADAASLIASPSALSYVQTGLSSNTAYGIVVAGLNPGGQGALSLPATTYTLAAPPAGTAVSGIWITSAAISWELNGNPPGTAAQVQRSSDGSSFAGVFLGAALSVTDAELDACTTYYFRVRNRNGDGQASGYDAAIHFTTSGSAPSAAGGLTAESLSGGRIALEWGFSPSADVTQYRLYYGSGAGTIDYTTPLAVFSSTVTSWTTAALTPGTAYKFGLRTTNRCGIEEANTSLFATAAALGSLTGVRAAIKSPQTGRHIKGNSVTVAAELLLGKPAQIKQVSFQYSIPGADSWTELTAANINHPNPGTASPYLMHWDVDALNVPVPTAYELRAVATDTADTADAAPPGITIVVDPVNFEINENFSGGRVEKEQELNNVVANTVQAADGGSSLLTKIVIPAGALDSSTVTITVVNNPAVKPPVPPGAEDVGMFTRINLSNGQSRLAGGKTAMLTLNYKDDDDNGVVDGTSVRADYLRMYSAATAAGPWALLPSSVDRARRSVTGTTPHFSFFAVFAAAASDLSAVRVYPNPFKPGGGKADEGIAYSAGNPNSGIVFDNLTEQVTITIYTVTGQLVAKFSSAHSGGKIQWDAKNDSGRDAASGGYAAVISGPGHSAVVKKILIVR